MQHEAGQLQLAVAGAVRRASAIRPISARPGRKRPCTPAKPLFGEQALQGEPVKIGSPHFVDFGKNMEHSPDGKAYLVAHGACGRQRTAASPITVGSPATRSIWPASRPSIENINDASKYEFFGGHEQAGPSGRDDFRKIKPIAGVEQQHGLRDDDLRRAA